MEREIPWSQHACGRADLYLVFKVQKDNVCDAQGEISVFLPPDGGKKKWLHFSLL